VDASAHPLLRPLRVGGQGAVLAAVMAAVLVEVEVEVEVVCMGHRQLPPLGCSLPGARPARYQ
jgi:hypothetical protein